MAPPEKKQKTDEEEKAEEPKAEDAEMKDKEPETKEPEPPKELEVDAPPCKDPKLKELPAFLVQDTTLNVLQSTDNNILMSLKEGGIQHFMAGARANVGISKGRYSFEVKVLQVVGAADNNRATAPRNVVRIGFSTAQSELILGEAEEGIAFESEGAWVHNKVRNRGVQRFGLDDIVTAILNLDSKSPNFNTVSLFKNGVRASDPVPVPEGLKGKTLFPHVSYKGVSLHVNFGPHTLAPLPFKCRQVQDATKADVTVSKAEVPADGKYTIMFPVGMPDEGTFDWLDMFLSKNPQHVELSDRMILDWAAMSNLGRPGGRNRTCNDKPDMNFNIRELDDGSARRAIFTAAAMQQRNYIVMEVKGNLIKEDRSDMVKKFDRPYFKKVSHVVVGEPNIEFKKRSQAIILKEKQEASDKAHAIKLMEAKRKKEIERRQKEALKARKLAEKERKKAIIEAKKKAAEEVKKAKEEARKKAIEEGKEVEPEKEEEKEPEKEEEEEEEEPEEPEDADEPDEPAPKVELSADEKKQLYQNHEIKDLSPNVMSSFFTKFSIPEKDEGFDTITYEWAKTSPKCKEYITEWILERKITSRIEDISPSVWFHQKWKDWQTTFQGWHTKSVQYTAAVAKKNAAKIAAKAAKEAKKAKAEAAKKAKELAKQKAKELKEKAKAEGKEEDKKEENKEEEEDKDEPEEEEKEEEQEKEIDLMTVDPFGAEDVTDIGGGVPLFKDFQHEDWTMMALRFELHLLSHAFKKDANDPERPGIHVDHIPFYYNRYYKRQLNTNEYGADSCLGLVNLVNDAVYVSSRNVLDNFVDDELESPQIFIQLTEEARRFRLLRIDLGEESAALKLAHKPQWGGHGAGGGGGGQKQKWNKGGGGDRGGHHGGQHGGQQRMQQPQQQQQQQVPMVPGQQGTQMGGHLNPGLQQRQAPSAWKYGITPPDQSQAFGGGKGAKGGGGACGGSKGAKGGKGDDDQGKGRFQPYGGGKGCQSKGGGGHNTYGRWKGGK